MDDDGVMYGKRPVEVTGFPVKCHFFTAKYKESPLQLLKISVKLKIIIQIIAILVLSTNTYHIMKEYIVY